MSAEMCRRYKVTAKVARWVFTCIMVLSFVAICFNGIAQSSELFNGGKAVADAPKDGSITSVLAWLCGISIGALVAVVKLWITSNEKMHADQLTVMKDRIQADITLAKQIESQSLKFDKAIGGLVDELKKMTMEVNNRPCQWLHGNRIQLVDPSKIVSNQG